MEERGVGDMNNDIRKETVWMLEDMDALRRDNARLRIALKASRLSHGNYSDGLDIYDCPALLHLGPCKCGADDHNIRIDLALGV